MKKKFYYTFTFCLLLTMQKINAQTTRKDTIVTANTTYEKAGAVKRLFLGDHYRKEWATPVDLKVLNLDSVAGGLIAIKEGGGMQTKSLRLKGADGKEYVLRSVNKDPSKVLPAEFVGTFAADVVQDQISSSNPYAPVAVAALAEAAGIFHTSPEIVYVPASPRLDTFFKDFANTICLFEERPSGNGDGNAAFGYSKNIINSEKLYEKLYTDNDNYVDQKAFLKARLFDVLIGDWDRHQDQWLWASFKDGSKTFYKPIPRDRDQAFANLDGIIPAMAQKPWMVRSTKNFSYKIHDIPGLTMSGDFMDRNFTTELSFQEWINVCHDLQQQLTDEKIEEAFKFLPKEIYAISAQEVIAKLKKRRDDLEKYTKDYYDFLSTNVNVTGTGENELFEVTRTNNDLVKVEVYKLEKNNKPSTMLYQREFAGNETKEIRLYGLGGNDKFNINGNTNKSILIRVIGGNGKDSVIDNSSVQGWSNKTKLYDNNENTFSSGSELKRYITQDSLKNDFTKAIAKYDWFMPKFTPGYNPDDGLYLGGGIFFKKQCFGKAPYGYMQTFSGNYAFATGAYNFWYQGIFKEAVGKWDLYVDAQINAPNFVLNYYGLGNQTIKENNTNDYYRVRANEWIISPSLDKKIGKYQTLNFGLNYHSVKIENSEGRYISEIVGKTDTSIFSRKHFAGANINFQFNTTNSEIYPTRGLKLSSTAEFIQNIKESDANFVRFSSDASFFVSHRALTAAFRVGAATNVGDHYEFYQANTLGGSTNLRGFGRTRFAGKTSLYQNTELRYKFNSVNGYFLRGNWGLLAFFDNGRVWMPEENSNTWHYGYGGGVWFLPYNKLAFSATYGTSKEGGLVNIKTGFFF